MFPPRADLSPRPFQIDRRGLLCGLAALPASHVGNADGPLAAVSTSPDPIFAAIEAFKVAEEILDQATAAAETAIENGEITNVERWDAQDRCHDEVFHPALLGLITTTPATAAGLAALLGFVREAGGVLELIGDNENVAIFERSLEIAACALAGLPLPLLSDGGDVDA
jgi:hypothetical protein